MRPLTFKGFLRGYLRTLSGDSSVNLRRLGTQAATSNLRLREPLFLYAYAVGKERLLLDAAGNDPVFADGAQLVKKYSSWAELEHALEVRGAGIPTRYQKVYNSYRSKRDRYKHEARTKKMMWERILDLKEAKKISNYRIYKTLGLNPGNANAFLTHGDTSKLSLATAQEALEFVESL